MYYIFCFKGDKKEENIDTEDSSTDNDSDDNEERTLGDTTDILNMVMYLLMVEEVCGRTWRYTK